MLVGYFENRGFLAHHRLNPISETLIAAIPSKSLSTRITGQYDVFCSNDDTFNASKINPNAWKLRKLFQIKMGHRMPVVCKDGHQRPDIYYPDTHPYVYWTPSHDPFMDPELHDRIAPGQVLIVSRIGQEHK